MGDGVDVSKVKEKLNYCPIGILWWKKNFSKCKRGQRFGFVDLRGYRRGSFLGKGTTEHRLVYLFFKGEVPEIVDHINCNPLDNRIENLRAATKTQNSLNTKKGPQGKNPFKGVHYSIPHKKWKAVYSINNRQKHLGLFLCPVEAIAKRILHMRKTEDRDFYRY